MYIKRHEEWATPGVSEEGIFTDTYFNDNNFFAHWPRRVHLSYWQNTEDLRLGWPTTVGQVGSKSIHHYNNIEYYCDTIFRQLRQRAASSL